MELPAVFYKDVLIVGSLLMPNSDITARAMTVGGSSLTTLLAAKENDFTAVLPLAKGFNTSGEAELKVEYSSTPLEVNYIRPHSEPGVTVDGDLFVDGHIHYNTITQPPSPFWVAGRVNGITTSVLSSKGRHTFTVEGLQTGFYQMTWYTAHPDGANFIVFAQGEGTGGTWNILSDANTTSLANTPNLVIFIERNNNFGITDGMC